MSMDYAYGARDSYLESGVDDRNLKEEDYNEFPLHYPSIEISKYAQTYYACIIIEHN